MKKLANKIADTTRKYLRRKNRTNVKAKVLTDLPRLIINRSNKYIYAQVISRDGSVIASSSDLKLTEGTKLSRARIVGSDLASKLKEKKVDKVTFDRNGFIYHGRVKSIADGVREGGINM
ncbi:MAG: 50S ribosomal protein L18 [Candidatus Absconditabacteria bacterium]